MKVFLTVVSIFVLSSCTNLNRPDLNGLDQQKELQAGCAEWKGDLCVKPFLIEL